MSEKRSNIIKEMISAKRDEIKNIHNYIENLFFDSLDIDEEITREDVCSFLQDAMDHLQDAKRALSKAEECMKEVWKEAVLFLFDKGAYSLNEGVGSFTCETFYDKDLIMIEKNGKTYLSEDGIVLGAVLAEERAMRGLEG